MAGYQFWNQDSPGIPDQSEEGDFWGLTLAAGDFDHDGFDDLAVGTPQEDLNGFGEVGAVTVIYGTNSGLASSYVQFWTQDSSNIQEEIDIQDYFAQSLAAGDFNHDGFDDLAIGAAGESFSAAGQEGVLHIIYGKGQVRSTKGLNSAGNTLWSQNSPGLQPNMAEPYDHFGQTAVAGDFNGDGYVDLSIGAPGEDGSAGVVNVIYF